MSFADVSSCGSAPALHHVAAQLQCVKTATLGHLVVLFRFGVELFIFELVCRDEHGLLPPLDEIAALEPLETRHDNLLIEFHFWLPLVAAQDLTDNDPDVTPGAQQVKVLVLTFDLFMPGNHSNDCNVQPHGLPLVRHRAAGHNARINMPAKFGQLAQLPLAVGGKSKLLGVAAAKVYEVYGTRVLSSFGERRYGRRVD